MRLVPLIFASALILVFGVVTFFCGSVALAQTRTQTMMVNPDPDWQGDSSR